jgi:hypothetical protein
MTPVLPGTAGKAVSLFTGLFRAAGGITRRLGAAAGE